MESFSGATMLDVDLILLFNLLRSRIYRSLNARRLLAVAEASPTEPFRVQ
jgi:hypothetical protein